MAAPKKLLKTKLATVPQNSHKIAHPQSYKIAQNQSHKPNSVQNPQKPVILIYSIK